MGGGGDGSCLPLPLTLLSYDLARLACRGVLRRLDPATPRTDDHPAVASPSSLDRRIRPPSSRASTAPPRPPRPFFLPLPALPLHLQTPTMETPIHTLKPYHALSVLSLQPASLTPSSPFALPLYPCSRPCNSFLPHTFYRYQNHHRHPVKPPLHDPNTYSHSSSCRRLSC